MKLSVLDQSVALAGHGEDEAIRDTLSLARHCETLGYHRFWLSEHHGMPTIVGTAPEVLLAALAAVTERIRLGSAGIMLPHYAPLKVAEQFRVLDALAPGRIDLGVGRAPGGDLRTARALNPHGYAAAENFPEQIRDLQAWVTGLTHQGLVAHPRPQEPSARRTPQLWVLGSSDYGARLAAQFGLPYAFAYFFMDGHGVDDAMSLYRSLYQATPQNPKPHAAICVWALAADTAEEARHQALSRDRWRVDRARGVSGPLQSPDDIARQGFNADERLVLEDTHRRALVGTAGEVADQLRQLAETLQLEEMVINTWSHDPAVRRRSYKLIAAEFGLN